MTEASSDVSRQDAATAAGASGRRKPGVGARVVKIGGWILLGVAGFMLNEALAWARDAAMDKPDYLEQLAQKQEQEFKGLSDQLKQISGSLDAGDRKAFAQVKDSIKGIERTNTSLIQQLVLAKQENETLRLVTQAKAGVSGGYDFILAEDGGVRIDRDTIIGLEYVSGNGAKVNLTSAGSERGTSRLMGAGESLPFRSEAGQDCRISMVSFNDAKAGTASFVVGCSEAS